MIPYDDLSSKAKISGFIIPVKGPTPEDYLHDWEMGGTYIQVPFDGLLVKVWELNGVRNPVTFDIEVTLSAPGGVSPTEAKRILFSGPNITELALAFDQNMNPFVAFMDDGVPKIYWFDTIAAGMVFTTLPGDCYDLRACLDEHRRFALGYSDITLAYIRAGNLCLRYQSERFEIEHIERAGVGASAQLVSMQRNRGFRLQFRLRNYAIGNDPAAEYANQPYLAEVVDGLLRRSGIPRKYIDTTRLWTPIFGYRVASEGGADAMIGPLQAAWFFDPAEWDKKIRMIPRGGDVVATILFDDVLEGSPSLSIERVQEIELLRKVNMTMVDRTAGWLPNKQTAERRSATVNAKGESSSILPITAEPDFIASVATKRLRVPWGEPQRFEFGTGIPWTALTPTDIILLVDKRNRSYRMRLMSRDEDYGKLAWKSVSDAKWVYEIQATGISAPPSTPTVPGQVGNTILAVMNLPVQRDQDDELGLYVGARGDKSGWSGYSLYLSPDGGTTYNLAYTSNDTANIGETTTAMTEAGTTVQVIVPYQLESVTAGQISTGMNRAVIGTEEIQYQTATFVNMIDGLYRYNLTNVTRGVLRTLFQAWPSGSRFVAIDGSVIFAQLQRSYYGTTFYYKAVSIGQDVDDVAGVPYNFTIAMSQMEWAVDNVVVANNPDGTGVRVTWSPDPRLGTFGSAPYESKYFRGYRLKFSDGNVFDVPAGTTKFDYLAATGGVTVRILSLNDITGECAWASGSGGTGGTGGGTGGTGGGNFGDPDELFGHGGTVSDGYAGVPYIHVPGDDFYLSGGYWDAQAYGELCPGVTTSGTVALSVGFKICGWPLAAGTYTTNIRQMASSPTAGGGGDAMITETFTVYAYPTYSLIDLQWSNGYSRNVVVTTPPFTTFDYPGGGGDYSMPYSTGKRVAEFTIGASTYYAWVGINNQKGELTSADYTAGIGYGMDCAVQTTGAGVYRLEHDCTTGTWEVFKNGTSIATGSIALPAGKLFRMAFTSEYVQAIRVKYNFGNEAWAGTPSAGYVGIPMPAVERPVVFRAASPIDGAQYYGENWTGPQNGNRPNSSEPHLDIGHIGKSSGKWKVRTRGNYRVGFCKASFVYDNATAWEDRNIGGGPGGTGGDSIGWVDKVSNAMPGKIHTSFGGVQSVIDIDWLDTWELSPIWQCDFTAHKIQLCAVDKRDPSTIIIVYEITGVPSGEWFPAMSGGGQTLGIRTIGIAGQLGYEEWTISYP